MIDWLWLMFLRSAGFRYEIWSNADKTVCVRIYGCALPIATEGKDETEALGKARKLWKREQQAAA